MKYEYMHPRDELALTLERIYNYKMTTTSGGNLSIIDSQPIGGHVPMSREIIDERCTAFNL